jgi:hypothetical protein
MRSLRASFALAALAALCWAHSAAAFPQLPAPGPQTSLIPIASGASQHVSMHAGFIPYKLGASSSIDFSFHIQSPPHTVPQPLIGIGLEMPHGLEGATSNLGLADCNANTFYDKGIGGCPPNSLVGRAIATATMPVGLALLSEQVHIWLTATEAQHSGLELLYDAEGLSPVFSMLVFRGEVIEANPPYGEEISTFIPPIETLPEAPYASVINMHATIGPLGLTYYKRVHGRRVAYKPQGIELPKRCPRGGFKFAGTFTFLDQATKVVRLSVPCPSSGARPGG